MVSLSLSLPSYSSLLPGLSICVVCKSTSRPTWGSVLSYSCHLSAESVTGVVCGCRVERYFLVTATLEERSIGSH